MVRILSAKHLAGKALHLQNRLRHWLAGILPATP
jgi:hypothetical protein